jgi:DNA primase
MGLRPQPVHHVTATNIRFTSGEVSKFYSDRVPYLQQRRVAEWRGPCPIHNGKRDSFAVNADNGQWFCHSDCGRGGDIIAFEQAINGSDFKTAKAAVFDLIGRDDSPKRRPALGPVVCAYPYTDERRELLYEIMRHRDPKSFMPRFSDGRGGYIYRKHPRQVLYRLPEVLEAQIVFVTEGERDVETLREQGFTATTNAGGASAEWLGAYTETLRGREVVVIPDTDAPGIKHGNRIKRALHGKVARLIILELDPGIKDITAWFEAGHSEVELAEIVNTFEFEKRVQ